MTDFSIENSFITKNKSTFLRDRCEELREQTNPSVQKGTWVCALPANDEADTLKNRFIVSGVDEAGRGPLAGVVVASAVIFKSQNIDFAGLIDDSKKLSEKKRLKAYEEIINSDKLIYGVGICTPQEIDRLNILKATFTAMERALKNLAQPVDLALIDGNHAPHIFCKTHAVIKGDGKSISIAAASIIAKTVRDNMMRELAVKHPEYGWDNNFGYGTKEHIAAIRKFGITEHHRRTFAPIPEILSQPSLF